MPNRHRSFRLTVPEYQHGKRVKRRLWYLSCGTTSVQLAAMYLMVFGSFAVIDALGGLPAEPWGSVILLLMLLTPFILSVWICIVLRRLFLRFGWLSPEEAKEFFWSEQGANWPASWLEPVPSSGDCASTGSLSSGEKEQVTAKATKDTKSTVPDQPDGSDCGLSKDIRQD